MSLPTHEVFNQPLPAVNLFEVDAALRQAVDVHGAGWARPQLETYGALAGGALVAHGQLAGHGVHSLV